MSIWALSDLHLAISTKEKTMEVFGPPWRDYHEKIAKNWRSQIAADDLVLIPGDITWARTLENAQIDLNWIDQLPGTKVLIKGNHDSWWSSQSKLETIRPKSLHFLHQSAFQWQDVTIAGSRLWDTQEYGFSAYTEFKENPLASKETKTSDDEKIFARELVRLETSLKSMDPHAKLRLALTHYPPIGAELQPSRASKLLEMYRVDVCVFGHLHSIRKKSLEFGCARGVRYLFCSADYCDFMPLKIR